MNTFLADIKHALRLYAKTPFTSLLALVMLAVSMAVVTAFIALWNDLSLRPHPGFENAGGLVTIMQSDGGENNGYLSPLLIEATNEESSTLSAVAGVDTSPMFMDNPDGSRGDPLRVEEVTGQYFPALRPRLVLGRGFDERDHDQAAAPVAVIAYDFWQREYGGRPNVIGDEVTLSGQAISIRRTPDGGIETVPAEVSETFEIVGVMSDRHTGTSAQRMDVWLPHEQAVAMRGEAPANQRASNFLAIGRIAESGASVAAIAAELETRFSDAEDLGVSPEMNFRVEEGVVSNINRRQEIERQVELFLAGSILLAVVATCNIGLFLLARAPARRRELGIRMACGATVGRIGRQLVTETAVLVIAAAALGLVASLWISTMLQESEAFSNGPWRSVSPFEWRVLALVVLLAAIVTAVVALAPILGLRRTGIGASAGRSSARAGWGQMLAGNTQLAVAGVLGAVAVMFIGYLVSVLNVDPGFDAENLYAFRGLPESGTPPMSTNVEPAIVERERRRVVLESLPGVGDVAFGGAVPASGSPGTSVTLPPDESGERFSFQISSTDQNFIDMLGLTLLHGRGLEATDRQEIVVNETFARRYFGTTDVVGEVLNGISMGRSWEWPIVGVVRDMTINHPIEGGMPRAFQIATMVSPFDMIVIDSELPASELRDRLLEARDRGDLGFRVPEEMIRVNDAWSRVFAADRIRTYSTAGGSLMVLLLSAMGFYGTQRFLISAGRREYAIRAAVGAGPRARGRLVFRRGLTLALPGLVAGALLGYIATTWLADELGLGRFVSPLGATVVALAILVVLVLAASIGPALSTRRLVPAGVLREE